MDGQATTFQSFFRQIFPPREVVWLKRLLECADDTCRYTSGRRIGRGSDLPFPFMIVQGIMTWFGGGDKKERNVLGGSPGPDSPSLSGDNRYAERFHDLVVMVTHAEAEFRPTLEG